MTISTVLLASRMDKKNAMDLSRNIFNFLRDKGIEVSVETRLSPKFDGLYAKDLSTVVADEIDCVIVVGGDGSIMRVSNSLNQENPPPVLGVNIGSIGFLDETNQKRVFKDLEKVIKGEFIIEEVSKITAYLVKKNSEEIKLGNALNEILIISSKSSKVLQIAVKINGVFLSRSYSDGVIISTSTGSTAYNLSAGGAIVFPTIDIMQLTTLNPFARSGLKPIIVPIDSEIEIELLRPRLNAKIIIDGQKEFKEIQPSSVIKIRKADTKFKFIRLSDDLNHNYFTRLKKKIIGYLKVPLEDSPEE
ncbi:MAG: NAD kinase [Promethearchaeota archaeon]|nr:MAG: NAD kinase [Candidatus Lokiarchaeota archaeon]